MVRPGSGRLPLPGLDDRPRPTNLDGMTMWTPTRDAALRRLEHFVPRAGRAYAKLRNYDRGPDRHEDVSQLSPWIRHRLILEEEVIAAVLAHHSVSTAEKQKAVLLTLDSADVDAAAALSCFSQAKC